MKNLKTNINKTLDAIGRTIIEQDPNGNEIHTYYDKLNRKRFRIDANNSISEWQYDADSNLKQEIIYAKKIVKLNFNTTLTEIKTEDDVNDTRKHYFYNKNGKERFIIDIYFNPETNIQEGIIREFIYDNKGQEIKAIHYAKRIPLNNIEHYDTETIEALTRPNIKDLDNRISYCIYDAIGRERFLIDAMGVVKELRYNNLGKIIATIHYANPTPNPKYLLSLNDDQILEKLLVDTANDRIYYQFYDNLGRLEYTINSEGAITYLQNDGLDRVIQECQFSTIANLKLSYDELANNLASLTPNKTVDRIINKTYDAANRVVKITDALGYEDRFNYRYNKDEQASEIEHIDRNNATWISRSDRAKRLIAEISPKRNVTAIELENGKLVSKNIDCNVVKLKDYDANGNLKKITDGFNTPMARSFESNFNKQNQLSQTLISEAEIDNYETKADFDNRPVKISNIKTQLIYNTKGNKVGEQLENGFWKFFIYDTVGNLRYLLEPTSTLNTNPEQCAYKVKYLEYNNFGEPELEIYYSSSLVLNPKYFLTFTENGISFDYFYQLTKDTNLANSDQDRSTKRIYNNNGSVISVSNDEIIYLQIDEENKKFLHTGQPLVKISYNSFEEEVQRDTLISNINNNPIYSSVIKWRNRIGKIVAESNDNNHVSCYFYNVYGDTELTIEYAKALDYTPSYTLPLPKLMDILNTQKSEEDRSYKNSFDLRGDIIEKTRLAVPQYELQTNDQDLPNLVTIGTKNLSQIFTYSPTQLKISVTLEDGQSKQFFFYDSVGNCIAQTGVTRASFDEKMENVKLTPLTRTGFDAFNKPVTVTRYKQGTKTVTDAKVEPNPISLDREDQIEYTLFDNKRGLAILRQDADGNQVAMTYTATKQEARSFNRLSYWDKANNNYALKIHIDEEKVQYDAADRPIRAEIYRDGKPMPYTAIDMRHNNFDEVIEEDLGNNEKIIRSYDKSGNAWFSNEEKGINTLHFFDLTKKETAQIQSSAPATATGLNTVKYTDLSNIFLDNFPVKQLEYQFTGRDKKGRLKTKLTSMPERGLPLIPLQLQIKPANAETNQPTLLRWNLPHLNTAGATEITFAPVGNSNKKLTCTINSESKTDKGYCTVDVSAIPTDEYNYEITYYPKLSNGNLDKRNKRYLSQGMLQINNGESKESENIVVSVQGTKIFLLGPTNHLTHVNLLSETGNTVAKLGINYDSNNNPFVDCVNVASGRYQLQAFTQDKALTLSVPFNLYNPILANANNATFSYEISVQAVLETSGNEGLLNLNIANPFKTNSIKLQCIYVDNDDKENILETTFTFDETGQYSIDFPKEIKSVSTLTLCLDTVYGIVPVYTSEYPLKKEQLAHSHLIKQAITHLNDEEHFDLIEHEHVDETPTLISYGINDFEAHSQDITTQQYHFNQHTIIYISNITQKIHQLTFTDVSQDINATEKLIEVTGQTSAGITIDVTGLAPGNYPFREPNSNKIGIFTISKGYEIYSGDNGEEQLKPKQVAQRLEYDRWDNITRTTNSMGNSTDSKFNDLNKLIMCQLPEISALQSHGKTLNLRPTTLKNYNILGHQIQQMDANGNIQNFLVNEAGKRLEEYLGEGTRSRKSAYDALDRTIAYADASNNISRNNFNGNNLIISQTTPSGKGMREFYYNEKHDILRETNLLGDATLYNHDSRGNVSDRIEPNGDKTHMEYGRQREMILLTNKDGTISWKSTQFGIYTSHKDLSADYFYDYDQKKQKIRQRSTIGNHGDTKRLVHVVRYAGGLQDPDGTILPHLVNAYKVQREPARGQHQEFTYMQGHITEIRDYGIDKIMTFSYDTEGNVIASTVKTLAGELLRHQNTTFDNDNREIVVSDTQLDMYMQYDAAGNKRYTETAITNPQDNSRLTNKTTNTFDKANRLLESISSDGDNQSISYEYQGKKLNLRMFELAKGRRIRMEYNEDCLLRHTFDANTNEPLTQREYDQAQRLINYWNFPEDSRIEFIYLPKSNAVAEQVQYRLSNGEELSRTKLSDYTSEGIPAKQIRSFKTDDGLGNDEFTTKFTLFDSKLENEITAVRTLPGIRDKGVSKVIQLYDSNATAQAIIGADSDPEAKDIHYHQPQVCLMDNTPTGLTLTTVTAPYPIYEFTEIPAEEVKATLAYQTSTGQPLSTFSVYLGKEGKQLSIVKSLQGHTLTESGGTAFTVQAQENNNPTFKDILMGRGAPKNDYLRDRFKPHLKAISNDIKPRGPALAAASSYPPPMPREYVAQVNDTYDSIAENAHLRGFGGAIAMANGFKPLQAGVRVSIPAAIPVSYQSGEYQAYSDFKSKMLLALTPVMVTPHPDDDAGALETIVRVASMTIAFFVAVTTMGTASPIAVAISAMVTDAELQVAFKVLGLQKKIYINDIVESGISAGFAVSGSNLVVNAAKTSVTSQLYEMATGSRNHFDVGQVISAIATQFVVGEIGVSGIGSTVPSQGLSTAIPLQVLQNGVSTMIGSGISAIIERQNPQIEQMAASIIGTTIGNIAGYAYTTKLHYEQEQPVRDQEPKTLRATVSKSTKTYQPNAKERQLLEDAEYAASMDLPDAKIDVNDASWGDRLRRYQNQVKQTSTTKWQNLQSMIDTYEGFGSVYTNVANNAWHAMTHPSEMAHAMLNAGKRIYHAADDAAEIIVGRETDIEFQQAVARTGKRINTLKQMGHLEIGDLFSGDYYRIGHALGDISLLLGSAGVTGIKRFGLFSQKIGAVNSVRTSLEKENLLQSTSKHPLAGLSPENMVRLADEIGLKTPRNQLILWAGLGRANEGIRLSQEYALSNGGITLEMTPGGNWLNNMNLFGVNSPFTREEALQIWDNVSKKMIQQASGQVRSVIGQVRPNSIYRAEQVEILMNNKITGLDELYLKPKVVFGR